MAENQVEDAANAQAKAASTVTDNQPDSGSAASTGEVIHLPDSMGLTTEEKAALQAYCHSIWHPSTFQHPASEENADLVQAELQAALAVGHYVAVAANSLSWPSWPVQPPRPSRRRPDQDEAGVRPTRAPVSPTRAPPARPTTAPGPTGVRLRRPGRWADVRDRQLELEL